MDTVWRKLGLPVVAGVSFFVIVWAGFWVLKSQMSRSRRHLSKGYYIISELPDDRKDRISELPDDRKDRISELPDDVLSLIISRLTTRDAVKTSILSRRWRHVYTLANQLSFSCWNINRHRKACHLFIVEEDENFGHYQRKLVEGVDTALKHHSGSKIKSFHLVCCLRGRFSGSLKRWMDYIGRCGVEELTLDVCCYDYFMKLHHSVFSTDFLPSLKHLRLQCGSFQTPNISSLEVVWLYYVSLTSEAVECMLSNCSKLQELNLVSCNLPSKLLIQGSHLRLKRVMILSCVDVEEIYLSAPNLSVLEISRVRIFVKLYFPYVPLLRTLASEFYGSEAMPYVFETAAKDIPNLESMLFKADSFFQVWRLDPKICRLSKLRQLTLISHSSIPEGNIDTFQLAAILDACPLLLKFQLSMVMVPNFKKPRAAERAITTGLKQVEVFGFIEWMDNYYNFISYVLATIPSLEQVTLNRKNYMYNMVDRCWSEPIVAPISGATRCLVIQTLQVHSVSKNVDIAVL